MDAEIKELCKRESLGEDMRLNYEKLQQHGVSDSDFRAIFGNDTPPIYLMCHLERASQLIFHQAWSGSGFCYRRFNKDLATTEYIAYAGYIGAQTDNP